MTYLLVNRINVTFQNSIFKRITETRSLENALSLAYFTDKYVKTILFFFSNLELLKRIVTHSHAHMKKIDIR